MIIGDICVCYYWFSLVVCVFVEIDMIMLVWFLGIVFIFRIFNVVEWCSIDYVVFNKLGIEVFEVIIYFVSFKY